jgi:hypothetical protein
MFGFAFRDPARGETRAVRWKFDRLATQENVPALRTAGERVSLPPARNRLQESGIWRCGNGS